MKYNIGCIYVYNSYINEDDEDVIQYIKILDVKEYRNGFNSKGFKYSIVCCDENGNDKSDIKEWTEIGLINKNIKTLKKHYEEEVEALEIEIDELQSKLKNLKSKLEDV
jgi:hypothetical protein